MERGYWVPPGAEKLAACDGFYVDSKVVYQRDAEKGWEHFLEQLCKKLFFYERSLVKLCEWRSNGSGIKRFVVVRNQYVDIIAEDIESYLAIYVLIPEDCSTPWYAKRSFPRYVSILKSVLTELYPGNVSKRLNSQHIQAVG